MHFTITSKNNRSSHWTNEIFIWAKDGLNYVIVMKGQSTNLAQKVGALNITRVRFERVESRVPRLHARIARLALNPREVASGVEIKSEGLRRGSQLNLEIIRCASYRGEIRLPSQSAGPASTSFLDFRPTPKHHLLQALFCSRFVVACKMHRSLLVPPPQRRPPCLHAPSPTCIFFCLLIMTLCP